MYVLLHYQWFNVNGGKDATMNCSVGVNIIVFWA